MSRNIDLDLLDELIQKCEAKMASPFRKKQEPKEGPAMASESEEEPSLEEEPAADAMLAEKKEEVPAEDEADLDELLELYRKIKS